MTLFVQCWLPCSFAASCARTKAAIASWPSKRPCGAASNQPSAAKQAATASPSPASSPRRPSARRRWIASRSAAGGLMPRRPSRPRCSAGTPHPRPLPQGERGRIVSHPPIGVRHPRGSLVKWRAARGRADAPAKVPGCADPAGAWGRSPHREKIRGRVGGPSGAQRALLRDGGVGAQPPPTSERERRQRFHHSAVKWRRLNFHLPSTRRRRSSYWPISVTRPSPVLSNITR